MSGSISPVALAVVFGMSAVTYLTKASGFWVIDRIDPSEPTRDALNALPGGIVIAILAVRLTEGGPPEWIAGLAVVTVAYRTDNIFLALIAGIGVLLTTRNLPM